jgi:ATP-dependent Clp protease ATP-binding subunit ClpA|tara:strand:+ start:281 stop:448 length:168 start_codon:yes stop_codon:yes gene_type:complete
MDVDTVVVFERIKRCISTAKLEAKKGHNSPVLQRMEEIEALFDILERKVNGLSDV